MKKHTTSTLYFITGILNTINAIINFTNPYSTNSWLGVTYLALAVTFISLGVSYRKKEV